MVIMLDQPQQIQLLGNSGHEPLQMPLGPAVQEQAVGDKEMWLSDESTYHMKAPIVTERPRNSVRFNRVVRIAAFERVSEAEAEQVWYSSSTRKQMQSKGKTMAALYRKFGSHVPAQKVSDYRGYEGKTVPRQKQRLLANRCALYASKKGMGADEISMLYQKCNVWSADVAFVQGMHDYVESYNDDGTEDVDMLPDVNLMVPPQTSGLVAEVLRFLNKNRRGT